MKSFIFPLIYLGTLIVHTTLSTAQPVSTILTEVQELMHGGEYSKAEKRLREISQNNPYVLRLLVELTQRRGQEEEARSYARNLLDLFDTGQLKTSDEISQAAYAAWQLELWQDANQLFVEASKIKPASLSLYIDWGNLYLQKYNAAEAESIFQDAIKSSPTSGYSRWGIDDAYVGLGRALDDQFKAGSSEALAKALEMDSENLEGFHLQSKMATEENKWEEAEDWLEKGLKINKNYLPFLELKCVLEYLQGESAEYRKTRDHILKIKPNNGNLFEVLGDFTVRKHRLEEAIEFYRESVKRNPRQSSALSSLGINLLRQGQEEEGKAILEQAYANDPFNIWTVNTLRLLDSFDQFVRFETEHFRVKLHEKEAGTIRPYVEELLETSLTTLEQKYDHQVPGKYIFEMYPDHADFAVRTLGLPGLGALGATFGRTVAMDSPSARPPGQFHWGSTLWHELAHVVTLSLSNQKVPRWLTEGISMMEERQAQEGWGDYLTVSFVRAYENGELLPLSNLNSGFERPKSAQQLTISYFQAGWICEFLAAQYGFERLREMLVGFGQDQTLEEVFETVLDSSVEEVDRAFKKELDQTLKPLVEHLKPPRGDRVSIISGEQGQEKSPLEPKPNASLESLESLLEAWNSDPENYFINLYLGHKLKAEERDEEAIPYLKKALELFPTSAGLGSPYQLLSEIYEKIGDTDKALEVRERWWKLAPRFIENASRVGQLLLERNRLKDAATHLESAMYVNPLQGELHESLGEVYLKTEQPEKAVREFRVLLNLKPVDLATSHYRLAHALHESGDREEARRHVLFSLEIAPSFEEAQKLLLQLVRQ